MNWGVLLWMFVLVPMLQIFLAFLLLAGFLTLLIAPFFFPRCPK